jgi:alpha-glucosidase
LRRTAGERAFVCLANTTGSPVRFAAPGHLLLASTDLTVVDGETVLAPDSTSWWAV